MTILIHTIPDDLHAAAVQVALQKKGVESLTWFTGDFPSHQDITVRFSDSSAISFQVGGAQHCIDSVKQDITTVWHRRIPRFQQAPEIVEKLDVPFVSDEISYFLGTSVPLIGQNAFWVNGFAESQYADNKLLQLKAATEAGFKIPETLATNSPYKLRQFMAEMGARRVIYKPFRGYNWTYPDKRRTTYTKIFTLADLPSDQLLAACPGIYQEYTEKYVELRITVMGHHCSAVALHCDDKEDWRVASEKRQLKASEFTLPESIKAQCLETMRRLKLVFGCMDVIIDPQGEYVFLEVNEMGQFLWAEYLVPELNLLDAFCEFLISRDPTFQWERRSISVRRSEIMATDEFQNLLKQSCEHVS